MAMDNRVYYSLCKENEGKVELYTLAPGIGICFNEIHTDSWTKGDSTIFSDQMLILNFCRRGRCDASLMGNRYAIVGERQVCASTILPTKDFYYPGRLYEGIQIYMDRAILKKSAGRNFLEELGIQTEKIAVQFCGKEGVYLHRMSEELVELTEQVWAKKNNPELGKLRYLTVRLLHEVMELPRESETEMYFTRSQIAIVREAEAMILQDLSKRITAKEMAAHFGISESSLKLYVKGILGESYLTYFRKKRMEKAAELLRTTNLKIIEIANTVGYENQGKFAKVFAEEYGAAPLEYRKLLQCRESCATMNKS